MIFKQISFCIKSGNIYTSTKFSIFPTVKSLFNLLYYFCILPSEVVAFTMTTRIHSNRPSTSILLMPGLFILCHKDTQTNRIHSLNHPFIIHATILKYTKISAIKKLSVKELLKGCQCYSTYSNKIQHRGSIFFLYYFLTQQYLLLNSIIRTYWQYLLFDSTTQFSDHFCFDNLLTEFMHQPRNKQKGKWFCTNSVKIILNVTN